MILGDEPLIAEVVLSQSDIIVCRDCLALLLVQQIYLPC
jgi:hypothetical protein